MFVFIFISNIIALVRMKYEYMFVGLNLTELNLNKGILDYM
jgi:hypothetical protein